MSYGKDDVFNLNENFNEFVFARVIEQHNVSVRETGQGDFITARQGRELHNAFLKELQDQHCSLDNAVPGVVRGAIAKSVGPHLAAGSEWKNKATSKDPYEKLMVEYQDITGIALSRDSDFRKQWEQSGIKFNQNGKQNAIPISPFSDAFAGRETILDHGTQILWAKADEVVESRVASGSQVHTPYWKAGDLRDQNKADIQLYELRLKDKSGKYAPADTPSYPAPQGYSPDFRAAGPLASVADISGITPLRQYMTQKEWNVCSAHMRDVPDNQRMTPSMIERAQAIVEMLRDRGLQPQFSPDRLPGQIKLTLPGSKVNIRITEQARNSHVIGRVYNDGVSMMLSGRGRNGAEPTVTEMKALVDYGLSTSGPVQRVGMTNTLAGPIGSPSGYTNKGKDQEPRRTSYLALESGERGKAKFHSQMLGGRVPDPNDPKKFSYFYIRSDNSHSNAHMDFNDKEAAQEFLSKAVTSARENFKKKVGVDYLIAEHADHASEEDYIPLMSDDPSIKSIQMTYWNVLTGHAQLAVPTDAVSQDHSFDGLFESLNQNDDSDEMDMSTTAGEPDGVDGVDTDTATGVKYYAMDDPAKAIQQHLDANVDIMFGQYTPDSPPDKKQFSASMTAMFMDSAHGVARNKDNLVAAMLEVGMTGEQLLGDDFETGTIRDKMLKFDAASARSMADVAAERLAKDENDQFMQIMLDTITSSLVESGCDVRDPKTDILIDKNGVVQYQARMRVGIKDDKNNPECYRYLEGQIGQIFEPDEDGLIETRYAGSQNRLFTPGYEAYIVPETDKTKGHPLEERYRFRGIAQVMASNIQQAIKYDVLNVHENVTQSNPGNPSEPLHTGTTTSLNGTYRGLYHTGYKSTISPEYELTDPETGEKTIHRDKTLKETFLRQMELTGVPEDMVKAIWQTARGMVHFDKSLMEGSSVNAEYRAMQREGVADHLSVHTLTNDNVQDPWELTGHQNMAITAKNSSRLFDDRLTGSGKNQGAIRYFGSGAGVKPDGTPVFSKDEHPVAPIRKLDCNKYSEYIPADRAQMALSNQMTASGQAYDVGVAQLTLQGLTFDDGCVLSKAFADGHPVIDEKGKARPLMPGDKICDSAGNKSIVAAVIDPKMDPDEAAKKGIDLAVQLFRDNPHLDVVQAPYSAVSRFNAASFRYAIQKHEDLVLPDGSVHPGCIGHVPMTITHHTAEDHTKSYDEDDVREGRGRKVSAQQAWMLDARGAKHMLQEIFGPNDGAVVNMREYMNTLGYDLSPTGQFLKGYHPQGVDKDGNPAEKRFIFKLPNEETLKKSENKTITDLFTESVGSRGGFMELPFPLEMKSGEMLPTVDQVRPDLKGEYESQPVRYALPVMSSHLRSGQQFEDGTKKTHDYTNQYQQIYASAISYLQAEKDLQAARADEGADADKRAKDIEKAEGAMRSARQSAQRSYTGIMDDVLARKFESKHNLVRDELMARRMPNSVTAVWVPKPNIGLNEIAMSQSMAEKLNVGEGDRVVVGRDPHLRTFGTRDMKVVIDNDLHGVGVNPLIAVSFDGDFDGDSVGIWALKGDKAKEESYKLFSFEQNMLDFSRVRENGDFALMLNDSMDLISAEFKDKQRYDREVAALAAEHGEGTPAFEEAMKGVQPSLQDRRMDLEHRFNEVYRNTSLSDDDRRRENEGLMTKLSAYAHDVMVPQVATEMISYNSPQEHVETTLHVTESGAKGSPKKAVSYFNYAGIAVSKDKDGNLDPSTAVDVKHTLATEEDIQNTQLATGIKAHCTGIAGAVSQRGVMVLRDTESALEPALRLTYVATQSILQSKHDPIQAQRMEAMVNSEIRNIWKGVAMTEYQDANGASRWKPVYDNGQPVQATRAEWIQQVDDIYRSDRGLGFAGSVSMQDVKTVADALVDPNTGRMRSVEDPATIREMASPVDRLAYRNSQALDELNALVAEGKSLFDGLYSGEFAPSTVRANMKAMSDPSSEVQAKVRPLQPADTKASFETSPNKNDTGMQMDVKQVGEGPGFRNTRGELGAFDPSVRVDWQLEMFGQIQTVEEAQPEQQASAPETSAVQPEQSVQTSQPEQPVTQPTQPVQTLEKNSVVSRRIGNVDYTLKPEPDNLPEPVNTVSSETSYDNYSVADKPLTPDRTNNRPMPHVPDTQDDQPGGPDGPGL